MIWNVLARPSSGPHESLQRFINRVKITGSFSHGLFCEWRWLKAKVEGHRALGPQPSPLSSGQIPEVKAVSIGKLPLLWDVLLYGISPWTNMSSYPETHNLVRSLPEAAQQYHGGEGMAWELSAAF